MSDGVKMGEMVEVSALQLVMLCDRAIERYCDMLQKYNEKAENGIVLFEPPEPLEAARDEVVEFFNENAKVDENSEEETN